MAEMKYLDFDLLIERSEDHYKARVLNSPAGQATVDFSLPFSEQDIEIFILKIGRPRRGTRRMNSPEMEAAKTFGGRLFETVFHGDVLGCFRTSLHDATQKDTGLRVRLRITNAPDLADLPWEYFYNPALNRFLSLSVETPIIRYLELPEPIRPLTIKPPLRVLVMISSPHDYPKLHVEQEWEKLKNAVGDLERDGLVTLERVEKATLYVLQRRLRQKEYHIYHFIGHGGFDKKSLDGVLILEDENERGRPINGQYLGTLLHDHRPLRLAILNACEGARASSSDPFAGTAQSLVQQGIPAVIAMQFEITDDAAITFADELYGALVDGYPVDAALAEARKAIYAQGNDIEWGTPVLYMRSPDGRVFDIARMNDEERREAKIAFLIRGAKAAMVREDWRAVKERLQEVLALESAHPEARAILRQLPQEQELASLYSQGMEHYGARRWPQALECFRRLQEIRASYKNVNALVAAIDEEIRQDRIAVLLREAKEAVAKETWRTVIEKYQAILELEPTHTEARAGLSLAEQEQDLANLYAQGHIHYEAKRWSDALECFHRVQEIKAHFRQVDNLIASIQATLNEQTQHEKVTILIGEAEEKVAKEDWTTAIKKYHTALQLAPNHTEAKAGLSKARQEQYLAEIYVQGQKHFQAQRLSQALDCFRRVQKIRAHYKQMDNLIAAIERAQDEQSRREKIAVLMREAKEAVAKEDWQTAYERYQAVLKLESNHAEAKVGLSQSQQEQELAKLYAKGREHYEAKRWPQAMKYLRQVQKMRANYKDVEAIVAAVTKGMPKKDKSRVSVRRLVALVSIVALLIIIIFAWLSSRKDRPVPAVDTTLSISTNPDQATVFLNGESIGITPIKDHHIKAGTVSLRIEKQGCFAIDSTVIIEAGRDTSFSFSLKSAIAKEVVSTQEFGELQITSVPTGVSLSLNGKIVGRTPYKDQQVKPGSYRLMISKDGYQNYSQKITVRRDQNTSVEVKLTKLAKLVIHVKPSGSIYIDGRFRQENRDSTGLPAGTYRLKVENRELGKWEKEVKVEPDQPNEIVVDFNKKVQLTVTAIDTEGKGVRAKILVDKQETEYSTPRKLELRIGLHTIAAQLEGYELVGGEQLINFEDNFKVQFTLKKIQ